MPIVQKKDPRYGKSAVVFFFFFFTVKLDTTNSFPSETAAIAQVVERPLRVR